MVDKSKLKKPKAKKPDSLAVRPALAGLGALRNKAFNELSQSDNAAVQAAGKSANAAFSEFSRMRASSLKKKNQLYEKRVNKARMKAEKTGAKLEVEKNKSPFSEKSSKKANKKKAQKKQLRKKRNAEMFKQNMKKAAKKARDEIARKAADFIAGKGKFIALGVLGFIMMMMVPMIFSMMMGGGGGTINNGAVIGVATYTTDRKGLIDFNNQVNDLFWQWQSSINSKMDKLSSDDTDKWLLVLKACSGGPVSDCPNIESSDYTPDPDNVYKVIKHLYKGGDTFSDYDITCLYAYFTVKYRDKDWESFSSEFSSFFETYYELEVEEIKNIIDEEVTIDTHVNIDCEVSDNGAHNHDTTTEEHTESTTDVLMCYYLRPKDPANPMTIKKYIDEQIKTIGEIKEGGKTEGELHYEMLMKSLGYHQVIDYPVLVADTGEKVDWSGSGRKFGSFGEMYDVNEGSTIEGVQSDYRFRQKTQNSINISTTDDVSKLEAVAGGDGVVKNKTANYVEIEYPEENLIVKYSCKQRDSFHNFYDSVPTGMTTIAIGSPISSGEHLFYSTGSNMAMYPGIEISAYCTETNEYINPLLVIRSKDYV